MQSTPHPRGVHGDGDAHLYLTPNSAGLEISPYRTPADRRDVLSTQLDEAGRSVR